MLALLLLAVPPGHARDMAAGRELFTKEVRAILLGACFKCHGEDKTRGGLDLATRESLLKGGDNGPAAVPGQHARSRLWRLASRLDEPAMPPKGHPPLPREKLAALARWIDLGAPYDRPLADRHGTRPKAFSITDEDRAFWSFKPLARPSVPAAKGAWGSSPIDRFLLAGMEAKGLAPSPSSGKRLLARRMSFTLTGLPPTPAQLSSFLADTRPDAAERLADGLLSSPAFGEKWARHWLDVARFAESHGFEHDYDRPHAWPYRDFVVRAFNEDLPYRDFARWQIAGDRFSTDPWAKAATGFLGAGVHSTQITANTVEKERYDELDDIVRTTGTAFLGLTVGCARCHDHKYDPVSQKDYYRLVAAFTKTVRSDLDLDLDPQGAKAAKARHAGEVRKLEAELAALEAGPVRARLLEWLGKPWRVVRMEGGWAGGAKFSIQPAGPRLARGTKPGKDRLTLTAVLPAGKPASIRLEPLAPPSRLEGGPDRASKGGNHAVAFDLVAFADLTDGAELALFHAACGRGRIEATTTPGTASADRAVSTPLGGVAALKPDMVRIALRQEDAAVLLKWYRTQDGAWRALDGKLQALRAKGPGTGLVKAMVCGEGLPALRLHTQGGDYLEHTHFLHRGDPGQKGEVARPGFPGILDRGAKPEGADARRSLALWLTDTDKGAGHLLARVIANRLWQHHFGRGLVATPSDFGSQGERPTHPELLDWLACELIDSGWSLKRIHRLIVASAAYRQASAHDRSKAALDPENKLLWRWSPRRLEAEAIRDSLLAVSGQLDRRMGGPGTLDARMPRRSLYFFLKRSQLNPMMTLFDGTDGTVGIEARTTTTTAPQALLLLNSPIVREAAKRFAARVEKSPDPVGAACLLALGRPPTEKEGETMRAFLATDPAGLPDLCQVLFGLNEFVYVE
ncbi:MAG: PSD1 and planctomycete cytochrome C domain-containing protein [Gemmataceae bacterium]|nr:PSD1 and planctomycete cytochrome C domain-containing protein [Gemmataceae bacterium]